MSKPIEALDPNFRAATIDESAIVWRDARELTLEGLGWPDESQEYCRLPDHAQELVREPVWELSRHSAGVCVRLVSDAPQIAVRWSLRNPELAMPHMPASGVSGLDLYARDSQSKWRWCGAARPEKQLDNEATLLDGAGLQEREYCLYAPLYNGVSKLEIGVRQNAKLESAPARKTPKTIAPKRIGFYGTSIVQGGCATRPGMAYPAILGRALDCATINLGFSGNAQSEPEIAALLAELDVGIWVLDPLPNMGVELIHERLGDFVRTVRNTRPSTPIVLVENIEYQSDWITGVGRALPKNMALQEVHQKLLAGGVGNLHYVAGKDLLGEDGEGTVDGVHPTDVGFTRMAGVLLSTLQTLIAAD